MQNTRKNRKSNCINDRKFQDYCRYAKLSHEKHIIFVPPVPPTPTGPGERGHNNCHWPALQLEMTQPKDIMKFRCCWSGLAWNGSVLYFIKSLLLCWCHSHLLNLWVEDFPGAFLKPVHVHCTVQAEAGGAEKGGVEETETKKKSV